MAGLADFIYALGTGDRVEQEAYAGALGKNAGVEAALAKARVARDEAMRREKLPESLRALGISQPEALSDIMRGGFADFLEAAKSTGELQTQGFRGQAFDVAKSGDVDLMNRMLSVLSEKPLQRTDVGEGVAYDPFAAPSAQQIQELPLSAQLRGATGVQSTQVDADGNLWLITREGKAIPATDQGGKQIKARPPGGGAGIRVIEGVDPQTGQSRFEVVDIAGGQTPTVRPKSNVKETETTEGERKNAASFMVMQSAEKMLDDAGGQMSELGYYASQAPLGQYTLSSQDQKAKAAMVEWYREKLRNESGAAIGVDEAFEEAKRYFPVPGDSAETIRQKKEARQVAMEGLKLKAGRAAGRVEASPLSQQLSEPPPVNTKGWVLHTDAQGNRAYVSPDGKQFEEVK